MSEGEDPGASTKEARPSLVDIAEDALRTWLATGRHRPGERLPPEQELSAHLGISRGTLRTALQRLEESGAGVERILTSGGDATCLEGLDVLASLVQKAGDRVIIVPGGGITERNIQRILGFTPPYHPMQAPVACCVCRACRACVRACRAVEIVR